VVEDGHQDRRSHASGQAQQGDGHGIPVLGIVISLVEMLHSIVTGSNGSSA
jgi:hypothetical protein